MARIPDEDQLGIAQPTAVATATRAQIPGFGGFNPEIVATPAAKKALAEWQDRLNREEVSKAQLEFQLAQIQEDEAASLDADIDTIDGRYERNIQNALGRASENITDARIREQFLQDGEQRAMVASAKNRQRTQEKKNERERGYMANAIDTMVKGAMDLEYGDPGTAAIAIRDVLDSQVERGVVGREDAERTFRQAQLDMAHGRLKAMDPEEQLAILDSEEAQPWLSNIPPDTLATLRREAEDQAKNSAALRAAFSMSGMETEDGLQELERQFINGEIDERDYEKRRSRFLREKQDQEVQLQKELEDYYEEGARSIWSGESTLDDMQASQEGRLLLEKMTEAQRRNLEEAQNNANERAAGRGRKYSDRTVVDTLHRMLANGQDIEARKYWSENYAKLNDRDFEFYDQRTSPSKSQAPEFKPLITANALMTDYLQEYPLDEEQERMFREKIDDKARDYYEESGKQPPRDMVNGWIRDEHREVVLKKPYLEGTWLEWGGKKVLVRDMEPAQREEFDMIDGTYRAAGLGPAGVQEYQDLQEWERREFMKLRERFPDMDPMRFIGVFNRELQKFKQQSKAGQGMSDEQAAAGIDVVQDIGMGGA